MKKNDFFVAITAIVVFVLVGFTQSLYAQQARSYGINQKIQFGGGVGLNFGSGFTDITLAPSAIYNVNPFFALGGSLQFGYSKLKYRYESYAYGGSLIGLVNPIPQIQLSAELEQMRVETNYLLFEDNFWNTAFYLGAGYRTNNVTFGIRYDVLHDGRSLNSEAFMPFVRVYF